MVAKINHSAQLYKVVAYNQQKVDAGTARIIGGNRVIADLTNIPERQMQRTLLSFENHLLANRNTEKPILHISLNPTLDDRLTDAQFAASPGTIWSGWVTEINPTWLLAKMYGVRPRSNKRSV